MSLKSYVTNNRGMTLLELLLVVTILSAVAWMSLGVVGNRSDQLHFDDTRQRINAIRYAIIGDTSRKLNGHSEISGYIADMGRVPTTLNELLQREYCPGFPDALDATACSTAGGTWDTTSQPAWGYDSATGLWAGWNGPYLTAAKHKDYPRFQDGWGANDGSDNFGWNYSTAGGITLQSYGRDSASGGTEVYDQDYPPTSSQPVIAEGKYITTIPASTGVAVKFKDVSKCWRCEGVLYPQNYPDRAVCLAGGGTWEPLSGYDDYASCSVAGIDGIWLPTGAVGYGCVDPTWLNASDCEGYDYTTENFGQYVGRMRYTDSTASSEACVVTTVTDQTTCVGTTMSGGSVGVWTLVYNGEMRCSDGVATSSAACITPYTWELAPKVDSLCLITAGAAGGTISETVSTVATTKFSWDGQTRQLTFPYSADVSVYPGRKAYGVYLYDTASSTCTSTKFSGDASVSWEDGYTVLPGRPIGPLEWNMEEHF